MRPERLDVLGVDNEDRSLVAFEIKGPDCGQVELENLFLQGLAHRRWLERNKMAVELMFDGPRGRRINARKRVRLLLGFFQEEVPALFWEMREEAMRDPYLRIDFVDFAHSGGPGGGTEAGAEAVTGGAGRVAASLGSDPARWERAGAHPEGASGAGGVCFVGRRRRGVCSACWFWGDVDCRPLGAIGGHGPLGSVDWWVLVPGEQQIDGGDDGAVLSC